LKLGYPKAGTGGSRLTLHSRNTFRSIADLLFALPYLLTSLQVDAFDQFIRSKFIATGFDTQKNLALGILAPRCFWQYSL